MEETKVSDEDPEETRIRAGGLPFCRIMKDCGHECAGVLDEVECLPCLKPGCVANTAMSLPSPATGNMLFLPDEDEECNICFSGELGIEPAV